MFARLSTFVGILVRQHKTQGSHNLLTRAPRLVACRWFSQTGTSHAPIPIRQHKPQRSRKLLARASRLVAFRQLSETKTSHAPLADIKTYFRFRDYNRLKWTAIILGCAGSLGFFFRENIKAYFGEQGADVATRTIADPRLKQEAQQLSAVLIQQILSDPRMLQAAITFLQQLTMQEATKTMLVSLLKAVANDPYAQQQLIYLAKLILQTPEVHDQAVIFAKAAVHDILDDPVIQQHVKDFFKGVFADNAVQASAGDGIWKAVKVGIFPRWLVGDRTQQTTQTEEEVLEPLPEAPLPLAAKQ
eukprot:TRINITY_DN8004_c0_g1_i1.p1 TRINITY_DN8004_c0_g1~~TRINITY_DN8004_c0_g1_i1.p1  ORF type:complete len:302 (-),score=51.37 TRINITY_DN8004_c0_g1_i1:8-913(-)